MAHKNSRDAHGFSKEIRTIAMFGDVDEDKAGDISMGLLMLTDFKESEPPYIQLHFTYRPMAVLLMRCFRSMI